MLSTETRLKIQFLCSRIENGEQIRLSDMQWLQKWANSNKTAYEMLARARRRSISGAGQRGSMTELLDGMNISNPDPSDHLTGDSDVDQLVDFFRAPSWMRRD